ncbi:hypothetical protein G6N05_09095 [Flavobacterium sp. F372]|uniref:Uncharacterized protein n=1 Tax=Flavobacterium bernardetii TaxID=2813823 RepID=A0ABR7IY88_9FLAO|nr:hypothetical protein [Flavobacterium bernardetii]MBC5834612.1 hypothetical protein [Flavobacterium bernardetii]NHF70260.1 hypothetical protein [Flavobacterium bernardetii]
MQLSNFILNSEVEDLKIGSKVSDSELNLDVILEGSGDIPSIYNLEYKTDLFEITTYKGIILGISFDFKYDTEKKHQIKINSNHFNIGFKTSIRECLKYFEENKLEFQYTINEFKNDYEIKLANKVTLIFDKFNLYKVYIFDMELYNEISK